MEQIQQDFEKWVTDTWKGNPSLAKRNRPNSYEQYYDMEVDSAWAAWKEAAKKYKC